MAGRRGRKRLWRCGECGGELGDQAYQLKRGGRYYCESCWQLPPIQAGYAELQRRYEEWRQNRKRCQRCGRRPATFTVGTQEFDLCGRCKTAVLRAGYRRMTASPAAVVAGMGGRSPISTQGWASPG